MFQGNSGRAARLIMAVLLECASCYQHYTVPQQALRQPTLCPWCGASSAGPRTTKKKSSGKNRHSSKRSKSRSPHRAAVVDARRLPERRPADANGSAVLDKQKLPAGTNGVAILPAAKGDVPPATDVGAQPPQSTENRLPPLRRNVTGSTDPARCRAVPRTTRSAKKCRRLRGGRFCNVGV